VLGLHRPLQRPGQDQPDEILAWRWISPEALQAELAEPSGQQFTPWFKLEWERIWRDHRAELRSLR
jgi:isopentenyl-diphosphate delta-isomerase